MINQITGDSFYSSSEPADVSTKRPKFSMLDDLEQLNQIINGPGANEDNVKAQQALQKAYDYMKGSSSDSSDQSQRCFVQKDSSIFENNQDEQKCDASTVEMGIEIKIKGFKQPKIVISTKSIDLRERPTENRSYIKNYDNIQKYFLQDMNVRGSDCAEVGTEEGLFGKALHNKKKESFHNFNQVCSQKQKHQKFDSYKNRATPQPFPTLKIKR